MSTRPRLFGCYALFDAEIQSPLTVVHLEELQREVPFLLYSVSQFGILY